MLATILSEVSVTNLQEYPGTQTPKLGLEAVNLLKKKN